jgi:hypothetical protein
MLDLGPDDYRDLGGRVAAAPKRGLAKWLYFARHPILAFVMYQKAYPDDDAGDFHNRQANAILFGIGMFLIRRLHSG